MSTPIISVHNLSKKYTISGNNGLSKNNRSTLNGIVNHQPQEHFALKELDFQLVKGDVLGIIGRNGSGKSTLLRIMSGITKPTEGFVSINGSVTSILEIGTGFHPDLSGKENIFLYGNLMGMTARLIENRFDEIVEFSGIEKFIQTPVKNYSSGMYLRLALSTVLHSDVDILLLDEVMSVGDTEFRTKVFKKIQSFLGREITIVMVSHNMSDIMNLCNKCMELKEGQKKFFGTPFEGITGYIEQSQSEPTIANENATILSANCQWDWSESDNAPGNVHVKLRKVSIKTVPEKSDNKIYVEDSAMIEVEFRKLRANMKVQFMLLFRDVTGNSIFYTSILHNDSDARLFELYSDETGVFCTRCQLPGGFLNPGMYSFQLRFGLDITTENYIHEEPFQFQIHENPANSYFKLRDMPVPLRPTLPWQYLKVEE